MSLRFAPPCQGKFSPSKSSKARLSKTAQTLVLLEAMKMENALTAEGNARVATIHVADGDLVELGQVLVELEPIDAE